MTQFVQSTVPSPLPGNGWFVNPGRYWTQIEATGQHSNGTTTSGGRTPVDQWADRRWVSDFAGVVRISGRLAKADSDGGDGITGHIWVDAVQDYAESIAASDTTGVTFTLTEPVTVGSTIDFGLEPNNAVDLSDSTTFTATITAVPEPVALSLFAISAGSLVRRRCRTGRFAD